MNRKNQSYYNYRRFGHLAENCRNKKAKGKIGKERRLEYKSGNNRQRRIIKGG